MNEAAWMNCTEPQQMLTMLRGRTSPRKLRLLACEYCREVAAFLPPEMGLRVLGVLEGCADGLKLDEARANASVEANNAWHAASHRASELAETPDHPIAFARSSAAGALAWTCAVDAEEAANRVLSLTADAQRWAAYAASGTANTLEALGLSAPHQTNNLRHHFGHAYRRQPKRHFSFLAVELAGQLYAGADARLVLHDALLDDGHEGLAHHFGEETRHFKGCWVLDLILGKK